MCVIYCFCKYSIVYCCPHVCFTLTGDDPRKWYPKDGGWEMHVVSTVSEWIVATSFCVYILSYVQEFRTVSIEEPQVMHLFNIFMH